MENSQVNNQVNNTGVNPGNTDKTFTQEEVNRIVQERLSRERSKTPSEIEKALEAREKALEARERESAFRSTLKAKNIPEEVYEALNCTSEETFNKSLEILGPYFQKANEPILNAVGPANGPALGDPIRNAMGLK